ncbi:MAG: hypothetical protein K6E97_04195 [Treponema sp.]|nr:hypothetical protein [Treponema sp.]
MKKLICFLILLIFGGFCFFKGWTTIRVDADKIGIVKSKLKGIRPEPVENGKFAWYWDFLIPTNATLIKFSITPVNTTKTITGKLPLSNNDFTSFSFTYSVSISYSAQNVADMVKNNLISNQEDLEKYMNNAVDSICQQASNHIIKKYQMDSMFRPESIKRNELVRSLDLYRDFPYFDITVFAITDYVLPDYNVYSAANPVLNTVQDNSDNKSTESN